MNSWITVIGIGEDGLAGLKPAVRSLIDTAELLVGGDRHQAMVTTTRARRLTWAGGLPQVFDEIGEWRGRRVVVLATGDPMWFGGGANLSRRFGSADMTVIPFPGAFSLAAARMLWPLADVEMLTLHGRPVATLNLAIQPGARLLILSRDGDTPAEVAARLTERGFGPSPITVLEHLGGPDERRLDGIAERWDRPRTEDLNTLAVECRPGPQAKILAPVPGLPDEMFESDGQLTKREVRAVTLSALAPLPGQRLWDIGAGAGSIAIEWLRAVPSYRIAGGREARAVAVECDANRCASVARNAVALGVPHLEVRHGEAPAALADLPAPDAIFIGGGIGHPQVLQTCWDRLTPGGRLVANAVTVESVTKLIEFRARHGGSLSRLAVARAEPIGDLSAFRPLMEVTQLVASKT
jgi:precorrin-6Y C5,15-methyltransferase (decarboxylating)